MTLAALMKKGGLRQFTTATATTGHGEKPELVARVATIAVAIQNPLKPTFGTDIEKHKSVGGEFATAIPTTAATDEVETILAVWRDLFGLQLDRDRVRKNLTSLKQWRTKRGGRMNTCRHSGFNFPEQQLYHLPRDFVALCEALNLPAETVTAMIDAGKIPIRRAVDKNGRRYGPILVWLQDVRQTIPIKH